MMSTLDEDTVFPKMSPTAMLLVAHVLEIIYLAHFFLSSSAVRPLRALSSLIPQLKGDIVNLQPSLFNLTQVNLIFDDSRARLPIEKGGLGYCGPYKTLEGLCKTVEEHHKAGKRGEERSLYGGVSFGWGQVRAERAVEDASHNLDPTRVMN